MQKIVNVIGGGLAGCEAAYQLLKRGIKVNLYEMKPNKYSPAHKYHNLGELVCSNSLKSDDKATAGGILKAELRMLDSLLIACADETRVPAGNALAVNREDFSDLITKRLKEFTILTIINEEVVKIDTSIPTIIATGPLTSDALSAELKVLFGEDYLYFFDAIAPIVAYDSIDFDIAFEGDRYGKGTSDYINCPMDKDEYLTFQQMLVEGEIVKLKDFENHKVFEGCMPIEVLAKRGVDTMRFGPLKPVGIEDPHTNRRPYAVIQLRRETKNNDFYNMVGFQTNLTYPEQKRIFSAIPGLKNAEFLRYGTMHRNTYINAPRLIDNYRLKKYKNIFIAGQLSGVEGYIESISSGLVCGINMYRTLMGLEEVRFNTHTMIGALSNYISTASEKNFQPMSSNMGIINFGEFNHIRDKKQKNLAMYEHSIECLKNDIKINNI